VSIELKGLSREQVTNLLPEGLISLCWRGSVAHGMYVPKSDPDSIDDKDVMGVFTSAPIEHYLGFGRQDVYEKWEGEWDCVFYELRKFIGLLLNCNPNVLSLLWLKDNGIFTRVRWAVCFAKPRPVVTKKAYHSFSGYANDQFKKMISFNQEAQALMRELEQQLLGLDIDPDSTTDGHALKTTSGQLSSSYDEMMEVVKRYKGSGEGITAAAIWVERRELVMRVGYDARTRRT